MNIVVTFNNRQLIKGEIESESNVESVGVHADGLNAEDAANALMTVIGCLMFEPLDVVHWLILSLDSKDANVIRREMVASLIEGDTHEIAMQAIAALNRDEQEKIATDILGQWGKDIVESYVAEPESEETNEPL